MAKGLILGMTEEPFERAGALEGRFFIQGSCSDKAHFPYPVFRRQGDIVMLRQKQAVLSWQVADDEETWLQLTAQNSRGRTAYGVHGPRNRRQGTRHWSLRVMVSGLVLLVLLGVTLGSGYRLYYTAKAGVAVLENELQDAIVLEGYKAANSAATFELTPATLQSFDVYGDVAVVEVLVADASHSRPYRETRFYRQVQRGWRPSASHLRFWGPQQQLESEYFVFRYHKRDAAAVAVAAPALDAFYAQLHQFLGRQLSNAGPKVTILVFASYTAQEGDLSQALPDTIPVPSPALQRIPADMSDAEAIQLVARMSLVYRLLPRTSAGWTDAGARPDER